MALTLVIVVAAALATPAVSHAHITFPPARTNGTLASGGNCEKWECFWFSQITTIPGPPTLNDQRFRTMNVDVSSGPYDWSAPMPWRAPGAAPVHGSGCGVAGGSRFNNMTGNGGIPPPGFPFGFDGKDLPPSPTTVWQRGSTAEVAWGIMANHGGGYSWRLCPANGEISEACFQRNVLNFHGDKQWIRHAAVNQWGVMRQLPDYEIDAVRVRTGTHPAGSEWTRNPIPPCKFCSAEEQTKCYAKNLTWLEGQFCSQSCSGLNVSVCPFGLTQFPEAAPDVSGFFMESVCNGGTELYGLTGFPWNIVDKVEVPSQLPAGKYLLSWRWDCEQSKQIWQNCADIELQ